MHPPLLSRQLAHVHVSCRVGQCDMHQIELKHCVASRSAPCSLALLHHQMLIHCIPGLCRWALLYTLPDAAKGDVRRDLLNTILAELYDFFYK